jgi:hypothetical protein
MILHPDAQSKQDVPVIDVHPTLYARDASAVPADNLISPYQKELAGAGARWKRRIGEDCSREAGSKNDQGR